MLGQLPTSLEINGKQYAIRTDYRNVLRIFEAYADDTLTDEDKVGVCLKRLFVDFHTIPRKQYADAYLSACKFIECNNKPDGKAAPKVLNWIKDEQIMFPAINKVAGTEIRALPYLHWWTFLGYFQSVDHEDLFSYVLSIRQKRAKGKKLEKWEREFYNNNRALCSVEEIKDAETSVKNTAQSIFESLLAEGGE